MATIGDLIGRAVSNFRSIGVGRSVAPAEQPKFSSVTYKSFRQGMISSVSPEDLPDDAGKDLMDVFVDRNNSLIRVSGITLVEDVTPRNLRWLFEQASLDFSSELIAIDAPYLGARSSAAFVFTNMGIAVPGVHGWNAVNVLGILLFSDGSAVTYTRDPGALVVTDISADIIALTFANFDGRTFAGAYTDPIDGLQGLGLKWNSTSGLVADWAGLGAGEELLIANSLEADKIVALRPIGFDALAILCRKSIWIGNPTGQADRPVDPRVRSVGLGCVAEQTATISPFGVPFLSDEGVYLVNQNALECLSEPINADLLPLDYTQLSRYKLVYMSRGNLLLLQTPSGTWCYEFPKSGAGDFPGTPGRWSRRSYAYDNLVSFTDQSGNVYWNSVTGTWDDQELTWNEMIQSEADAPAILYVADGTVLGREDSGAEQFLGVDMTPRWEFPTRILDDDGKQVIGETTEQITTLGFEITYRCSADCAITLETPDETGELTNAYTQPLTSTSGKRKSAIIWFTTTGMGVKSRYKIFSGFPTLFSVRQIIVDSGPVIGSAS